MRSDLIFIKILNPILKMAVRMGQKSIIDNSGINLENLGELLRSLRQEKDLTQAQVAKMVGVSSQHYSRIERGEYTPSLQTFLQLAGVLDLDISALDTGEDGKISSTMYEILRLLKRFSGAQQKAVLSFLKTMKPQKITLWLAQEQFPNGENDLPQHLIDLEHNNFNFFIEWCEDIKSYKKLIPALEKYPDSVIVTADDDLIYENDWLEKLYKAYKKHPEMIHCHRAHRITFDKQKHLNDYSHWVKSVKMINPSFNNFFTGGGGVLYPSHSLYKDVLNKKLFLKLAPTGDDIWFWAMAVMNNRKINIVKNNQSKLHYIEGTQENCLYNENIYKNDEQIRNVLEHYPNILEKLNKRKYREPFDLKTFIQQIISVKNERKHKVITILGMKIKIKCNNKP